MPNISCLLCDVGVKVTYIDWWWWDWWQCWVHCVCDVASGKNGREHLVSFKLSLTNFPHFEIKTHKPRHKRKTSFFLKNQNCPWNCTGLIIITWLNDNSVQTHQQFNIQNCKTVLKTRLLRLPQTLHFKTIQIRCSLVAFKQTLAVSNQLHLQYNSAVLRCPNMNLTKTFDINNNSTENWPSTTNCFLLFLQELQFELWKVVVL